MLLPTTATHLGAAVLALSGTAKLWHPEPARAALRTLRLPSSARAASGIGAVELVVGVAGLLSGSAVVTLALAVTWSALAVVAFVLRRRPEPDCGCFGVEGASVGTVHVVLDVLLAVAGWVALVSGSQSVAESLGGSGALLVVDYLVLLAIGAFAVAAVLTTTPHPATAAPAG